MSRDIPAIDAIIAGFCSSHDEPNAAEQAIAFDQSLERTGWSIVRTEDAGAIAKREQYIDSALERIAALERELELERAAHTACAEARGRAEDRALKITQEWGDLVAVIYEVTTNGQWTKGEQLGDWAISKEVYETARDAIGGQLRMEP